MTTATATPLDRLNQMFDYIRTGRILDAMTEFYTPDVVMAENANPGTSGLASNIEREKAFLASVKEWIGFEVLAATGDDTTTFYESTMEFIAVGGAHVKMSQVAVQRWRDGKIYHERFYYDSAPSA